MSANNPQALAPDDGLFRLLFRDQLNEMPKPKRRKSREGREGQDDFVFNDKCGWVFLCGQNLAKAKSCLTYQTLSNLAQHHTYYTPNTFFQRDERKEAQLRWLNAFILDVDVKNGENTGLILPDLLDRIDAAGLPQPSFVVQTPSGGYHVYFVLNEPRRAYTNAIMRYKKLQRAMTTAIGGDRQAVGAGRFFRLPTAANVIYRTDQTVSFEELNDWYAINDFDAATSHSQPLYGTIQFTGLLTQKALKKLISGAYVKPGKRDSTAYTLALAFKVSGYSAAEAEEHLHTWNHRISDPLDSFVISQKVQSAYAEGAPVGPTKKWIEYLSDEKFTYVKWEPAKARSERKTSHYHEWATDVVDALRALPDHTISGSQRELAASWGMSVSSFQEVIKLLLKLEKISVEIVGKGRGAKTVIRLNTDSNIEIFSSSHKAKKEPKGKRRSRSSRSTSASGTLLDGQDKASGTSVQNAKKNVPDSNTVFLYVLDRGVGGRPLGFSLTRTRSPDFP